MQSREDHFKSCNDVGIEDAGVFKVHFGVCRRQTLRRWLSQ